MSETLPASTQPAIILVAPQLGENVGTAARAMANFGLTDLRLVNPREGWPNEKAVAAASRADHVIERVRVFDTVEAAVADLRYVFATTARSREMAKAVMGPHEAAEVARKRAGNGVGFLFGREKSGLTNEEVSLADAILTLPVDPDFSSLNIAQAVLIIAYEWRLAGVASETEGLPFGSTIDPQAPREQVIGMFEHLERALDDVGFYRPPRAEASSHNRHQGDVPAGRPDRAGGSNAAGHDRRSGTQADAAARPCRRNGQH